MQKRAVHLRDERRLPFWWVALKARHLKQDIFLCGFGAPFEYLSPKGPARGPGEGPFCQLDSENKWPVRPLMQFDSPDLRAPTKNYRVNCPRHVARSL